MKEFLDVLTKYVNGERTCSAIEEWLARVDWDDPDLTQESKDAYGLLELLVTEVSEGLRDEGELVREAKNLLENESGLSTGVASDNGAGAKTGKDLVAAMLQDEAFMKGVERGLRDIEEGRYSTLEEVKKRAWRPLMPYCQTWQTIFSLPWIM